VDKYMGKILVVDDDLGILEAIQMVLEDEDHTVKIISSDEEVDAAIKEFSPDLVILDILLSGSDGRDICKRLKEAEKTTNIPIILASAHQDIEKDVAAYKADDSLAKPFELDELFSKVDKFVKN